MREGIYWRGSNRARRWQRECSPNQSFVLPSGRQARRRSTSVLVGFLILCFVTWSLSRFRTPSLISTESLLHQAPARAVVFELYWYYGHSLARNETFSALGGPVHRRGRGLLEYSEATELTREEIFDEEGFGDDLSLEFESLKKRMGCNNDCDSMACSRGASSSAQGASSSAQGASSSAAGASSSTRAPDMKTWPVFGGYRQNDQAIESLYTKIMLGHQGNGRMREYIVHVDTGSAQTWINCIGSPVVGPGGLFKPREDSYLNCETSREMCDNFQDGKNSEQPCDSKNNFRCLYRYTYGDGTATEGSVTNADFSFDLNDGSKARHTIAIGCSTQGKDADTFDDDEDSNEDPLLLSPKDGILGVGRHPAGLLSQLHSLNLFSEYVTAMCLDHARPSRAIGHRGRIYPMEYTGFLSFGDLYTSQAASTVWTASIIPRATRPQDVDAMYTAKLVEVEYRDSIINFRSKKRRKDDNGDNSVQVGGTHLGFDTGSDLTYLGPKLFKHIEDILNKDAIRMRYKKCQDAPEHARSGMSRNCWSDPKDMRKSLVKDFGELIIKFSSLTNDDTTSDLVIKPEYYITVDVQAHSAALRTCFNMRKEDDFSYGNLGAEAMRGHLILFNERPHQIGWSPVTSCRDLR